jgi:CheY-like chemotaxis protein
MASERILIVDDNPQNLKLIRVLLTGVGYEVATAVDAEDAQAQLVSFMPRLILMDIQLPGMDGLTLTRRLKDDPATRDILVVALTAYAMKGDEERARAAGCDGYISKPIDTEALPHLVNPNVPEPVERVLLKSLANPAPIRGNSCCARLPGR